MTDNINMVMPTRFKRDRWPFRWYEISFMFQFIAANKIRVNSGSLWYLHGEGRKTAVETEVTLTGTTEYVYVAHQYNTSTPTIQHSYSVPSAPTGWGYYPLYQFEQKGPTWGIAQVMHIGDFYFDAVAR